MGGDEDKEFLAGRVAALEDTVRFFSPGAKGERERWVVEQFLSFICPDARLSDIKVVEAEPWDAIYLGAKFQIKEVQQPGRRRHAEYKKALEKAKVASDPSELLETKRVRARYFFLALTSAREELLEKIKRAGQLKGTWLIKLHGLPG